MTKYLIKLKAGNSGVRGSLKINEQYYFNNASLTCGNNYKEGIKHKFYSDDETDIILLINIIRRFRFGTIITEIKKNSFEFENKTENQQIFFFRICRYVRTIAIKKILEDTILINKSGVKIQNAFLLAHYYNYKNNSLIPNIAYYSAGMDGFYDSSSNSSITLNKPYKLLKDFKLNFNTIKLKNQENGYGFNSLFEWGVKKHKSEKELIFKFLKEKDFKAAEKYLLHVWK
jgi:hypothetical protein